MSWRDTSAGELRVDRAGDRVTLAGWVNTRRDHGGLVFVDLRDSSGIIQVVINPERSAEAAETARQLRNEYVIQVEGEVVARAENLVNPNLPTGAVEVQLDRLMVLSTSTPIPFQLDDDNVDDSVRQRYRWLDLRRAKMQRNIRLRGKMVGTIRRVMEEDGFVDIQTPLLWKPTPEGARDFLVPSRVQKGRFYALPQSPQIAKQLLVIAGFERYYQIAICFRDEDLRADRVQEITQLDVELAFPDQEFLFALMERMISTVWRECVGVELETPFERMTHAEADRRFGSDKPDLRFALEIEDATAVTRGSGFNVFAGAERVRFLRAPHAFSRHELNDLEGFAKHWGARGLAYLVVDEQGEVRSPIAKFLSEPELESFRSDPGTTVLFAAGTWELTSRVLGALRTHVGEQLGLIDERAWSWLWVTDFPMFEWDEEEKRWGAVHHPFTRPTADWEATFDQDPANALALAYDLIGNGNELGGGSFRIHEAAIQARVFDLLGIAQDEQREKFGFLLDALAMGAPPHGGIAFGIDRMVMVLAGEANLRDTIAFPKNQAGIDPMTGAPTGAPAAQLKELGISVEAELDEPLPRF
ncbi:MAG: aspartate--tRNA ligase [Gaiellaceae bacterium]